MNPDRIDIAKAAVAEAMALQGFRIKDTNIVGSTYIKHRPDGDIDVLVLSDTCPDEAHFPGWIYGGSGAMRGPDNPDMFGSWKRTVQGVEVNLLLVSGETYFRRWLDAAEVCRFMHLKGVPLTRGLVHGIHEIIMADSDAATEITRRDYE